MEFLAPPAQGLRTAWEQVPPAVRHGIESALGAPVAEAVTQRGGFSPGVAARVRLADGRRAFVKAVSAETNAGSPLLHRAEARNAAALPPSVPAPRLLAAHDDGTWVALAFEDVAGRQPHVPWRTGELARVLDAVGQLSRALSPAPAGLDATCVTEAEAESFRGWERLLAEAGAGAGSVEGDGARAVAADGAGPVEESGGGAAAGQGGTELAGKSGGGAVAEGGAGPVGKSGRGAEGAGPTDPWVRAHLGELAELAERWPEFAVGDTLAHGDLRADNMLLAEGRVVFVDWPHAVRAAPWYDLLLMLPCVRAQGGPDPEEVFRAHPLGRAADPEGVTVTLAALAGYFVRQSLQPSPPGLPTLRPFQAAQGTAAVAWLRRRLG